MDLDNNKLLFADVSKWNGERFLHLLISFSLQGGGDSDSQRVRWYLPQ